MEASYKIPELAAKARQLFGTTPEVAMIALKTAGKDSAALEEAAEIIRNFLNREVK